MKKIIIAFIALFGFSVAAFAEVNTAACAGCHGKNFEKSAMGKSKIVANMSNDDVVKALLGYKNGTYGGPMKNLMKMQVSKYSIEDLKAVKIGKSTANVKPKKEVKKSVKKDKKTSTKTNVVLEHKNIVGYKEKNTCWVVDFKTKKSKLLKCSRLESAAKGKLHSVVPPTSGDIPNPFDGLLK